EPTVAVGCCLTVITASEVALVPQVGLVTVHLNVIVPAPLVGVTVPFAVEASGLKVPVAPPVTIDHVPVSPIAGELPPSPAVVLLSQIVCGPPVLDVGAGRIVMLTSAVALVQGAFATVHLSVIVVPMPPLVCVKVAPGVVAFGLNVPVTPAVTIDQVPVAPTGSSEPRRAGSV